jgi:hypothetical protein
VFVVVIMDFRVGNAVPDGWLRELNQVFGWGRSIYYMYLASKAVLRFRFRRITHVRDAMLQGPRYFRLGSHPTRSMVG